MVVHDIYTKIPLSVDRQFDDQTFQALGDGAESGNRCSRDERFHNRYLKYSLTLCVTQLGAHCRF